jgi:CRP-like cAMP-binding protein
MDLCGNLCASLYFFKRLELAQAVVLLEHADVRLFQAGEYVVKQNDFSDYMYVILMGSVVIDITLPHVFGDHPVVVNTLYDGQVFGEMSYFTSGATRRARRDASVIAQEESYLLRADPAVYLEVMKRNVDQDQTQKLAVLCRVPFFDFCTNYQLAPLAAHTETLSLRLGDRLVHQGQCPDGCYIIAEGLCTLLLSQDADPNPGKRDESTGRTLEPFQAPLLPSARIAAVNAGTNREGAQHQPKLAIPARSVPLVYGRLGPGQFLGLGALSDVRGRCAYPSQVTVQVDSSIAKVYMVTRKSLLHLPEASMNGVLQRLAGVNDPINPPQRTVDEAISQHHRWCKDKRRAVFTAMTSH